MDIKKIYKRLTPKQRERRGVGNLTRTGFFKDHMKCFDCCGPAKFEEGWGWACINQCWKLRSKSNSTK